MIRTSTSILLGCFLLSVAACASAQAQTWRVYAVPGEVYTTQVAPSIPDGWALSPDSSHNVLAGITIYDGPPEGNASLVYDKQSRKKHMLFLTWTLDGDSKKAFWIVCRYAGTTIQLKRQLPAGIKALRVTFDDLVKTEGEPTVEKIEYL